MLNVPPFDTYEVIKTTTKGSIWTESNNYSCGPRVTNERSTAHHNVYNRIICSIVYLIDQLIWCDGRACAAIHLHFDLLLYENNDPDTSLLHPINLTTPLSKSICMLVPRVSFTSEIIHGPKKSKAKNKKIPSECGGRGNFLQSESIELRIELLCVYAMNRLTQKKGSMLQWNTIVT